MTTGAGPSVLVRLYAGFGNNIFQIVTGHAVASRISSTLGHHVPCRVILPDPVDQSSDFSVFEVVGGHLRSDHHYSDGHRAAGLPAPDDMAAVLPHLDWITLADEGPARRRLRRKLAEALAPGGDVADWYSLADYFSREQYLDTICDARHTVENEWSVGQVLGHYFSMTTIPFSHRFWDPEARAVTHLFEPGEAVTKYLESTYGIDPHQDAIGIHMRNFLRVPDGVLNDRTWKDRVSNDWYVECVADVVKDGRRPKVIIVSNRVAGNDPSAEAGTRLRQQIEQRFPALEVIESNNEPYYVDYFLLRTCTELINSCGTFSFAAGITSRRMQRMYVPPPFAERHFCHEGFPEYCRLLPEPALS